MSRTIRAALTIAASVAAISGGTTAAHAAGAGPSAATAAPSVAQLQAAHSGQCLTIPKASLRNGVNAVQSKCVDGEDSQLFDLVPAGGATFEVRPRHSGKCLDVTSSATTPGAEVQQWWCVGGPQQRWQVILVDVPKKLYELRPTHTKDRCLDIKSASLTDGAAAQQYTCNSTPAQRWRLQAPTA
ncbi:RICIN domain-containing protein [Streptomyces sp. NPDC050856]|uniref:RICIN domain-containing protein n=1 Tax=Streptomyces sp. NPDC050856 TaxID=3154939 RepID=UPI00340FB204